MVIQKLVKLVQLVRDRVDDVTKKILGRLKVFGSVPKDLPTLEEALSRYSRGELTSQDILIVSARIGDLLSDPTYNRGNNLRYGNQSRDLKAMGGFSHDAAGVLSGYLRPNLDVVVTQGNNRVSMLYSVTQDEDSRITLAIKFHPVDIDEVEMIRVESENHNADCNFRTTQSGDDKFKSAYYSNQPWAYKLYHFLKPFSIGIAGTLEGAQFSCPSHSYVTKAIKEAGIQYAQSYLQVFTELQIGKEVLGNPTVGGSVFLRTFAAHIAEVDRLNGCNSFKDMMKYFFKDRENIAEQARKACPQLRIPKQRCVTQEDITKDNTLYKGSHISVCRFVSLYNEYCESFDLKFNGSYRTAIPIVDGKTFNSFIADVPPVIRSGLVQIATDPVVA